MIIIVAIIITTGAREPCSGSPPGGRRGVSARACRNADVKAKSISRIRQLQKQLGMQRQTNINERAWRNAEDSNNRCTSEQWMQIDEWRMQESKHKMQT